MIKKVAIVLLCSAPTVLCMEKIEIIDLVNNSFSLSKSNPSQQRTVLSPEKKIEFMKNGLSLSRSMPANQKIEFMRNGQQIIQQLSDEETKSSKSDNEKPFVQFTHQREPIIKAPWKDDNKLNEAEEDLINDVIKLSLNENNDPISEKIPKTNNVPRKHVIINYKVKIKQKLNKSSQNINLGNKNNNKNKN